jgi:hypothetical protein
MTQDIKQQKICYSIKGIVEATGVATLSRT